MPTPQKDSLLNPVFAPDHRRPPVRDRSGQKERRILLRCGRCKVVVGYYLDRVHWAAGDRGAVRDGEEEDRIIVARRSGIVVARRSVVWLEACLALRDGVSVALSATTSYWQQHAT
jgi:hypothetical protein